ncbi:hypothetical protein BDV93DRAFT_523281 [Ceratobasidium sp. AG-I]|nr:hypothetical protein BDV93DRAFT_523281 [Ceratobasidium sp. AG-I]
MEQTIPWQRQRNRRRNNGALDENQTIQMLSSASSPIPPSLAAKQKQISDNFGRPRIPLIPRSLSVGPSPRTSIGSNKTTKPTWPNGQSSTASHPTLSPAAPFNQRRTAIQRASEHVRANARRVAQPSPRKFWIGSGRNQRTSNQSSSTNAHSAQARNSSVRQANTTNRSTALQGRATSLVPAPLLSALASTPSAARSSINPVSVQARLSLGLPDPRTHTHLNVQKALPSKSSSLVRSTKQGDFLDDASDEASDDDSDEAPDEDSDEEPDDESEAASGDDSEEIVDDNESEAVSDNGSDEASDNEPNETSDGEVDDEPDESSDDEQDEASEDDQSEASDSEHDEVSDAEPDEPSNDESGEPSGDEPDRASDAELDEVSGDESGGASGDEPNEIDGSDDEEAEGSLDDEPNTTSNEYDQPSGDESSEHADEDLGEHTNHNADEEEEDDDDPDYNPNEETSSDSDGETDDESNEASDDEPEEPPSPSSDARANPPTLRQPPPTFVCAICLEPPEVYGNQTPTARCTHASTVCTLCLEQHISHAVLEGGSTTVPCPEAGCGQTLEYSEVIRGARNDRDCLARYETLLLRRTLQSDPNFVWCKDATCQWGQLHESGADEPIVICQVCRARSCFTHDVPWHTGQTCAQYDARRAGRTREARANRASEAYIQQHAKACPNSACGRQIEKIDGCDHMVCQRPAGCGHEFCWICFADYEPIREDGNHHHNPDCRHYAAIDSDVEALEDD